MKRILLLVAAALCFFACAKKDPFDEKVIEKDLKKRTAQEIWEQTESMKFDPPLHRRITDTQINDFVRMAKLAKKIRDVAERRFNEQTDRASGMDDRLSRMGEGFAAIGTARSYATADFRASLDLGLNPREQQWVGQQIALAIPLLTRSRDFDKDIAARKSELDSEPDPYVVIRREAAYNAAVQARQTWEAAQEAATVANARLVQQHQNELKEVFAQLDWQ